MNTGYTVFGRLNNKIVVPTIYFQYDSVLTLYGNLIDGARNFKGL